MQKAQINGEFRQRELSVSKKHRTSSRTESKNNTAPLVTVRSLARQEKEWLKTMESSVMTAPHWFGNGEALQDLSATHAMGWVIAAILFLVLVVNSWKARRLARGTARLGDRDHLIYRL